MTLAPNSDNKRPATAAAHQPSANSTTNAPSIQCGASFVLEVIGLLRCRSYLLRVAPQTHQMIFLGVDLGEMALLNVPVAAQSFRQ